MKSISAAGRSSRTRRLGFALALLSAIAFGACSDAESARPPSIVLVVLDTVRADAVSAYQIARETTPALDRLAREGVLYERAYATASWTLPSHASLFSGLPPERHGVSFRRPLAAEDLRMLAERLADGGYATAGVSENPWVTRTTRMAQGFEWYRPVMDVGEDGKAFIPLDRTPGLVEEWLDARSDDRPFFLFLNFMDAHTPYQLRDSNPFVPAEVSRERAQWLLDQPHTVCAEWPTGSIDMETLRGLYLGGVRAADVKLARVLALLRKRYPEGRQITVVASDHGEHFGEHGLRDHIYGLHQELLHVPLVVHGAPGAEPGARVAEPVALTDLVPTILAWVGLPIPEMLPGEPLPVMPATPRQRALTAGFLDPVGAGGDSPAGLGQLVVDHARELRARCPPGFPPEGDLRMALRHPFKLIQHEDSELRLYDLDADPLEQTDLAADRPLLARALLAELQSAAPPPSLPQDDEPSPVIPEGVVEVLRALGYAPDEK